MKSIDINDIRVSSNPRSIWVRVKQYGHAIIINKKCNELKRLIAALQEALRESEGK